MQMHVVQYIGEGVVVNFNARVVDGTRSTLFGMFRRLPDRGVPVCGGSAVKGVLSRNVLRITYP